MIQKLRKQFIGAAMLAIVLIMVVLMTTINVVNYQSIGRKADVTLSTIAKEGGQVNPPEKRAGDRKKAVEFNDGKHEPPQHDNGGRNIFKWWYYYLHPSESSEMPFEARYFTVVYDEAGKVQTIYAKHIHSVTESEAVSMSKEILDSKKDSGYTDNFRYMVTKDGNNTMVICLDRTRELSSFYTFLTTTILLGILTVLIFYILVLLFSKRIVRPMAESYEKQKQFITNAGHELKTPLAVIDSCTEVIEMTEGESKWTEGIHDQVKRLGTMTADLVNLSRMDESADTMEKTELDLTELADDTLNPFTLRAMEQGYKLNLEIADNVTIYGNERSLRQLFSILADNALKYAVPETEILLYLRKKGHKIYIGSKNRAEDLKKGDHSQLFDRFYRGDQSHNSEKRGYGIGLSMAQSISHAHGGTISAVSETEGVLEICAVLPEHYGKSAKKPKKEKKSKKDSSRRES